MISKKDIDNLYVWAKQTKFLTKDAPTVSGYTNKKIHHYWLKSIAKTVLIRKKLMSDNIFLIYQNEDILYSGYSIFDSGTELGPHKDPNIYREPYKRIQIPVEIPDKDKCYMIWKGEKVTWEEGIPQVFEVMDYIHEGYNFSDGPMKFLFVDVKKESQIEIK
jgi:aspartyl/asparaginyl beta-hydroxylase (cupin superfamily)